jgi:peroxiredoxin
MTAEIGKPAPAFTLKDQAGNDVSLTDFAGKSAVALVFYPFTFTGVCEGELCQLRDDFSDFEAAGVQVLAVSCDSRHAQRVWAEQQGYNFPVLSDFWPHGAVAKEYGVFNDALGCAIRATFFIDKQGVVVDEFRTDSLGTARESSRYREAFAKVA